MLNKLNFEFQILKSKSYTNKPRLGPIQLEIEDHNKDKYKMTTLYSLYALIHNQSMI